MKDLNLMVWLTQLGLSVAVPLGGLIWLSVWLRDAFGLGDWVVWIGVILGLYMAITGFVDSMKLLMRLSKSPKEKEPPVSFNDHD